MKLKDWLFICGIGATIIIIASIFLLMYWSHFDGDLSNKHETWGQAGDYFGGILNPIISAFTLLVTLYIALKLTYVDKEREEKQTNLQLLVLKRNIQHDLLKDFVVTVSGCLRNILNASRQSGNCT